MRVSPYWKAGIAGVAATAVMAVGVGAISAHYRPPVGAKPACVNDVVNMPSFDWPVPCDLTPPQQLNVTEWVHDLADDPMWREGFTQECAETGGTAAFNVPVPGWATCEGLDY